jgi:hypothetical protein
VNQGSQTVASAYLPVLKSGERNVTLRESRKINTEVNKGQQS